MRRPSALLLMGTGRADLKTFPLVVVDGGWDAGDLADP